MKLLTERYAAQQSRWPQTGRHILAQFDNEKIVVYQAYCPEIGRSAAKQQRFGGSFSLTRMSWIKPNFLWMMYRCGWATKENQETVLAVSLRREAFDAILAEAVPSTFSPTLYSSEAQWKEALSRSEVRLQWDPDHAPDGAKVERRALQLGLRGDFLARYAREWIVHIENITDFVVSQRQHVQPDGWTQLVTPREDVYPVNAPLVARIGLTV